MIIKPHPISRIRRIADKTIIRYSLFILVFALAAFALFQVSVYLSPSAAGFEKPSEAQYLNPHALAMPGDPSSTELEANKFPSTTAINSPLRVSSRNPRYFSDATGKVIYLTGSHTWSNFQDNGKGNPPPVFDYTAYLDFLTKNHHNFFRLWTWEQSRWTVETSEDAYWFNLMGPFERTEPGTALDGLPKNNLEKFNQAYFDRMRSRIIQARDRGIYVSVMLFDGWSIADNKGGLSKNNPWKGHPFNLSNNNDQINGDPFNHNNGLNTQDLSIPEITAIQERYIKKVIDTVNDLDNVLYEIDNEGDGSSVVWQYHMINFIKAYESSKTQQHPVGMTSAFPNGRNQDLFNSPADWISPNDSNTYLNDPPPADGSKIILSDTDHLCGICGDETFVWKSFTRGINPIFMDGYDGKAFGVGGEGFNFNDDKWVALRANLGYALFYAEQMNLAEMTPRGDLCSTGYCLANPSAVATEFLVYAPFGERRITVDLSSVKSSLNYHWLNPQTGQLINGSQINGGTKLDFDLPFNGDAVLYIFDPSTRPNKSYLPLSIK